MIKINLGMHNLDCLEEVVRDLHERWGKDIEVNVTKSNAAVEVHSPECIARMRAAREEIEKTVKEPKGLFEGLA